MTTWMIEGLWSGPHNPAGDWTKIPHREFTTDAQRVADCRRLRQIMFTDGTFLTLRIRKGKQVLPSKDTYGGLITRCLAAGVDTVAELHKTESEVT